jgi:hypothetical protein
MLGSRSSSSKQLVKIWLILTVPFPGGSRPRRIVPRYSTSGVRPAVRPCLSGRARLTHGLDGRAAREMANIAKRQAFACPSSAFRAHSRNRCRRAPVRGVAHNEARGGFFDSPRRQEAAGRLGRIGNGGAWYWHQPDGASLVRFIG